MALSEQRRLQLDGIVRQMVGNKEADDTVQFVVNDFVQKYQEETLPQPVVQPEKKNSSLIDVGIGALKGVGSTLAGASELGEKILIRPLDKVLPGKRMTSDTATSAENLGIKEAVRPTNSPQKLGFGVEQIAEFFIPGGAATKAGKAVEASNILTKTPKLKAAAELVAKALAEGGIASGQVALQEGEVNKGTLATGVATAALSPVGGAFQKVTEKLPKSLWTQVLNRTSKMVEKNPNLEKQAAELGIAGSRKKILSVAKENIQRIETELDDLLVGSQGSIEGKQLSSYLDELRESYKAIPGEEAAVSTIENIQNGIVNKGVLNPKEANELKRTIYEKIANSYGKGTLEVPAKAEAQKMLARGLKQEIEKVIPEAKSLNEKQAVYLQVKKAIDRVLNQPRKGIAGTGIGWYDLMLGGIGLGATGGDYETAAKLVVGKKLIESATIRTGVAKMFQYFNNLSPTKKAMFYNALKGSIGQITQDD